MLVVLEPKTFYHFVFRVTSSFPPPPETLPQREFSLRPKTELEIQQVFLTLRVKCVSNSRLKTHTRLHHPLGSSSFLLRVVNSIQISIFSSAWREREKKAQTRDFPRLPPSLAVHASDIWFLIETSSFQEQESRPMFKFTI